MTLSPFKGRCHVCGHDHDDPSISLSRFADDATIKEIERLTAENADLNAALNADWGDGVMQENLKAKKERDALAAQVVELREACESINADSKMVLSHSTHDKLCAALALDTKQAEAILREREAKVLEEGASAVENEHVGESVEDICDNEPDHAYNVALKLSGKLLRRLAAERRSK